MSITEAALLREVARVQHNKTLLAVRDLIDGIKTWQPNRSRGYGESDRTAKEFRADLLEGLRQLREAASE